MSQIDILLFLHKSRKQGNRSYFSMSEITKGVNSNNSMTISRMLRKLVIFGFVQQKTPETSRKRCTSWAKRYRLREKHIATIDSVLLEKQTKMPEKLNTLSNELTNRLDKKQKTKIKHSIDRGGP